MDSKTRDYTVTVNEDAMPSGVIWPTYEDGSPVMFGCATEDTDRVCRISFTKRGFYFDSSHRKGLRRYRYGEPVKRAAVAGDGRRVKAGETLYHIEDGRPCKVLYTSGDEVTDTCGDSWNAADLTHEPIAVSLDGEPIWIGRAVYLADKAGEQLIVTAVTARGEVVANFGGKPGGYMRPPTGFTARNPVFGADCRPLVEGDRLRCTNTGEWCGLVGFAGGTPMCLFDGVADPIPVQPEFLTHDIEDSWERLEEDAANLDEMPCDYNAKDLVLRARKLAGVSE